MPAQSSTPSSSTSTLEWRPTKIMNMRDLSKDDDFLSHLLVEKLGTGIVPLLVHKMDPSRRLPKTSADDLLNIVRRLVSNNKVQPQVAFRMAVNELLLLPPVRYYLKNYTQKQINAFSTHASRYFELYHPSGSIEISHTSRYSHRTGKSELCILATRKLAAGAVITELKGSMANLTDDEDKELKRTGNGVRSSDIRRDFSVIHSKQMKKNHLFLGPARFVNHDCDNNVELFREGRYITFRTLRPIAIGEEITAHYGDSYFGHQNKHCLCETCEKAGQGGYAPHQDDDVPPSESDSDSDGETKNGQVDQGVYAVTPKREESDESEEEDDDTMPLAGTKDVPEIELSAEVESEADSTPARTGDDGISRLSSLSSVSSPADISRSPSSLSSLTSLEEAPDASLPTPPSKSPFRSIISTRRQKREAEEQARASLSAESSKQPSSTKPSAKISTGKKHAARSVSTATTPINVKGKQKETQSATPSAAMPSSSRLKTLRDEVKVKKEDSEPPRILRTRPSAILTSEAKEPPKPTELPRDSDGKLLPLCSTCTNILPVISVDSQVVWGLELTKKNTKQECPRCMRHFAIYQQPWPRRVQLSGSSSQGTPREITPAADSSPSKRVSDKLLSVVNSKLKASISAPVTAKRPVGRPPKRPAPSGLDIRSSKRLKIDIPKASISAPSLSHRRYRQHRLSHRKQSKYPVATATASTSSISASTSSVSAPPPATPAKRGRGRPRIHPRPEPLSNPGPPPPKPAPKLFIKQEPEDVSITPRFFKNQPRSSNGQFEKKRDKDSKPEQEKEKKVRTGPSPNLSRSQRAAVRERTRQKLESTRSYDRKRVREDEGSVAEAEAEDEDMIPDTKRARRDVGIQRTAKPAMSLLGNPNPLNFAMRAWARHRPDDTDSSSASEGPVTPSNNTPPPVYVHESEPVTAHMNVTPPVVLTFSPSPFNFAKRRWSSTSDRALQGKTESADDAESAESSDSPDYGILTPPPARSPLTPPPQPTSSAASPLMSSDDETTFCKRGLKLRLDYPTCPRKPDEKMFFRSATDPGPPPNFINAGWDTSDSD